MNVKAAVAIASSEYSGGPAITKNPKNTMNILQNQMSSFFKESKSMNRLTYVSYNVLSTLPEIYKTINRNFP